MIRFLIKISRLLAPKEKGWNRHSVEVVKTLPDLVQKAMTRLLVQLGHDVEMKESLEKNVARFALLPILDALDRFPISQEELEKALRFDPLDEKIDLEPLYCRLDFYRRQDTPDPTTGAPTMAELFLYYFERSYCKLKPEHPRTAYNTMATKAYSRIAHLSGVRSIAGRKHVSDILRFPLTGSEFSDCFVMCMVYRLEVEGIDSKAKEARYRAAMRWYWATAFHLSSR